MKQNNRGQAALEFLLTYSWAILVVIVIIGALAYFGVLSPENFIPERCTLSAGVACDDYAYTKSGANSVFELALVNGLGQSINVTSVSITSATDLTNGGAACVNSTSFILSNGASQVARVEDADCESLDGVEKLRATIDMNYTIVGSSIETPKQLSGEIFVST